MSSLLEFLSKVEKVNVDLSAAVAIEETASAAVEAQRDQIRQGLKSDGTLMPDYSFRSVFQYNKPPGPIKLFDTGAFYGGFLIDVRRDIFILDSADPKSTMLQNRYGTEIFGLGYEARVQYIPVLRPVFIKELKSYLQ